MKRNIVLPLLTVALLLGPASAARADVDVSLNVFPNNFADLSQGGSWSLVAKTDTPDSDGIISLLTRFEDGTIPAAGTVNPNIGHELNGGVLVVGTFLDPNGIDFVEFVYGQDPIDGVVFGVGQLGGPSDIGADPLGDPAWDNASEIAFGTIPDLTTLPNFLLASQVEVFEMVGDDDFVITPTDEIVVRVAIPEPGTAVLLCAGWLGCLGRRRRK